MDQSLLDQAFSIKDFVVYLAPLLPYLMKSGESAAEEMGKSIAGAAWDKTKALWSKLRPKIEAKPAALEAVNDAAESSSDEDAQATLRVQLKKLFSDDQHLLEEVTKLWGEIKATGLTVTASGKSNVAIGGNVSGSTIIIGDKNKNEQHKV